VQDAYSSTFKVMSGNMKEVQNYLVLSSTHRNTDGIALAPLHKDLLKGLKEGPTPLCCHNGSGVVEAGHVRRVSCLDGAPAAHDGAKVLALTPIPGYSLQQHAGLAD
jgi:hypothetical protein